MVVQELRQAAAQVTERARHVQINTAQIPSYAASLPVPGPSQATLRSDPVDRRAIAWYWLTLNAINFGSGWFPTLRKAPGRTGYRTVSSGLQGHFDAHGPWSAEQLQALTPAGVATVLGQDPDHELMALFSVSLNDLGTQLMVEYQGDPLRLIHASEHSATALIALIADWPCFRDISRYEEIEVPFFKRAQITAADLARSGAARFEDLDALTMFADNLVPHVLRLDGILSFTPELVARIDAEQLIAHGSLEEVEIRASAVHAVDLIVTAAGARVSAAQVDELLWQRGQGRLYKGSPRHRSRCTAY